MHLLSALVFKGKEVLIIEWAQLPSGSVMSTVYLYGSEVKNRS